MLGHGHEKLPGVIAVQLGAGRLREVHEDDVVAGLAFGEETPGVLKDKMHPGVLPLQGRGLGNQLLYQAHQVGVQLHIVDAGDIFILQGLGDETGGAPAQQEDLPGIGMLQQAQVHGHFGGVGVGVGEVPDPVGEKALLLRLPGGGEEGVRGIKRGDHLAAGPLNLSGKFLQRGTRPGRPPGPGR